MKKIYYVISLLTMLLVVWSCGEKDNLDPIGNWELSEPITASPSADAALVLDEEKPTETFPFSWQAAVSSKQYQVRYTFVLDSAENADFSSPILSMSSANSGRDQSVAPTARQIDQALSAAGYTAGTAVPLKWGVIATSLDKQSVTSSTVTITRFATESSPTQLFISGSATEKGADAAQAIAMREIKDADGNPSGVFELYTSLKADGTFKLLGAQSAQTITFGGADGKLERNGAGIVAPAAGQYRITVDFNNNSYNLLKIDKWSVVGDVIAGGWGGDEPLEYKGNSVWQGSIDLVKAAGFVFRANGDWAYLLKRVVGTNDKLVMESMANGVAFEDIPSEGTGPHIFTIDLAADKYTYKIEADNSITPPANTPDQLYLLSNGETVAQLTKSGNSFTSGKFLALKAGENYTLNTAQDGSGSSFSITGSIGESTTPDADNVTKAVDFGSGKGALAVARDQAYQLTVNFTTGKLTWKYYNIKLFHWDEAGGGWDNRDELLMTYVHPYKYEVTANLKGGYDMKFNSPWDVQFGTDSKALSGTMTNGGANYKGITADGSYKASIEVTDDYTSATYSFVKQ
jgi:starch-binding outer membrane protein SusE/F